MRYNLPAAALGLIALMGGGCGGSSESTGDDATSAPSSTSAVLEKASATPSAAAQMICSDEAKKEIEEGAIGVDTVQPLKPTWTRTDHIYACDYVYKGGAKMTLSVKEMSSPAETTTYFDALAEKYGKLAPLKGLGEDGFTTPNGSVVVRKDYKVLLVDASGLPAQFGIPLAPRGDEAVNVAAVIMGCWIGA